MKEKVKVFQLLKLGSGEHILFGTINDIRTWAKNLWSTNEALTRNLWATNEALARLYTEEEFYSLMDGDVTLSNFLQELKVYAKLLCEVPLDDFYDNGKIPQELVDEVLHQIKVDIAEGDLTALDELLKSISIKSLLGYLPEKNLKNNS
jgi:hypothetical protein